MRAWRPLTRRLRFIGFVGAGAGFLLGIAGVLLAIAPTNAYETGGDPDPPSADVGDVLTIVGFVIFAVGFALVAAAGILRAIGLDRESPLTAGKLVRVGVALLGAAVALLLAVWGVLFVTA